MKLYTLTAKKENGSITKNLYLIPEKVGGIISSGKIILRKNDSGLIEATFVKTESPFLQSFISLYENESVLNCLMGDDYSEFEVVYDTIQMNPINLSRESLSCFISSINELE